MGSKNSRLEKIRGILGLNKTAFADAMGITNRYYYNILNEKSSNSLRLEHLESLLIKYQVNPAWVLTGEGEMFLRTGEGTTQWIAGHIIPEVPATAEIDQDTLDLFMQRVLHATGLPILTSDLAYSLALRFGRYYIHKNPGVAPDQWDVPALTSSFLALLQTVQSLVDASFDLGQKDTVVVRFEGQNYTFVRHRPLGK